jgi:hypothetical protein
MASKKNFLFTFGLIALGTSALTASDHAQAAEIEHCSSLKNSQAEEECACEAALDDGSIEALEEFLDKYGKGGNTACTALAMNRLSQLARPDNDPERSPPFDPGY